MYLKRDEGIVIKSYDYGEGHRIVVIFTENSGKIKAVAKGSRKTKSKFGASLEPLTLNEIMLYRRPDSDLGVLTGVNTLISNQNLRDNFVVYGYCSLMLELIDILITEDDPHPEAYQLFKDTLSGMEDKEFVSNDVWLFIFKLLKDVGYRLDFFKCGNCNSKDLSNAAFIPSEGSVYCRNCSPGRNLKWPVSPEALSSIKKLNSSVAAEKNIQKEIGNIVKKFIEYQFDRTLNSIKFLNRILDKEKDKNVFSGTDNKIK